MTTDLATTTDHDDLPEPVQALAPHLPRAWTRRRTPRRHRPNPSRWHSARGHRQGQGQGATCGRTRQQGARYRLLWPRGCARARAPVGVGHGRCRLARRGGVTSFCRRSGGGRGRAHRRGVAATSQPKLQPSPDPLRLVGVGLTRVGGVGWGLGGGALLGRFRLLSSVGTRPYRQSPWIAVVIRGYPFLREGDPCGSWGVL